MCELAATLLECWNDTHECDMYIFEHPLQISVMHNPMCACISLTVCVFGCICGNIGMNQISRNMHSGVFGKVHSSCAKV